MSPAGFLALALLSPGTPPDAPPLPARGDELTYTGTVTESVDRPGRRFRRAHDLEVRVLTLDRRDGAADLAVLTLLRRADDGAVTGARPGPPAARLDLVRTGWNGPRRTTALLAPGAGLPLALGPNAPTRSPPAVPLDTFAPFELGPFPPLSARSARSAREQPLRIPAPGRPDEVWTFGPDEVIAGERCARLRMTQQPPDWDRPVGGQTAWQRTDTVWVSTRDETVRRVHRTIRHRDGVADAPAVCVEVDYELAGQAKVIGREYDRSRREIELGYAAAAELALLLPDAARLGPRPSRWTRSPRSSSAPSRRCPSGPHGSSRSASRPRAGPTRCGPSGPTR